MVPNDGSGSNDKEMPQTAVSHFRYAHSLLAAGRVLLWHQPEPSGKLPAGTEHFRVAYGGGQRGRGDEADAGDRLKSLAGRLRSMPSHAWLCVQKSLLPAKELPVPQNTSLLI